jgi:hypothetical protein
MNSPMAEPLEGHIRNHVLKKKIQSRAGVGGGRSDRHG